MNEERPGGEMHERLQALAGLLPAFESLESQFGTWQLSAQDGPEVFVMPYFELSETASAFVQMAYDQGWVLTDFDWPDWMGTEEAITLRDDPAALAAASPEQLAKLLTVLIRQDRFVEGALDVVFESGLLTAIVRRAAVLAGQDE